MPFHPSQLAPDVELAEALKLEDINVKSKPLTFYSDWEKPTVNLPDDFVSIYLNGDIGGVGYETPYANGYIMVSLYCKLNDDGSVKKSRIENILKQFDHKLDKKITEHYYFEYDAKRYITPTTPNTASGYSITTLNLRWKTTSKINS